MRPLLPLLFLITPAFAQDKALEKLAGNYSVKEFVREGKAVPDDVRKSISAVKIAGDKLTITTNGKELVAKLKVSDKTAPAEIDLFPQNEPFEKDRPFKGLVELKGNTLTLAYVEDGDRPKDFKTEVKTSTRLVLEKK
ncbi:MAG: TIGR03067 domain-containing protein [Fimbriiglobus sp.]|jgi:uncharacterized protein (TIGR03067 family)|nr:TIGR03067 domain-containing protein [Fimbriiglobus sp.]